MLIFSSRKTVEKSQKARHVSYLYSYRIVIVSLLYQRRCIDKNQRTVDNVIAFPLTGVDVITANGWKRRPFLVVERFSTRMTFYAFLRYVFHGKICINTITYIRKTYYVRRTALRNGRTRLHYSSVRAHWLGKPCCV